MKRLLGMTAALLLAASPTPASARTQAVSAADTADMQCFVVTAIMAGQYAEGSAEQAGLASGMIYFLGRLEGRAPDTDWLKVLADYILEMDDTRLGTELESQRERCGVLLENRGQALIDWGATVSAAVQARAN